MKNTFVAAAALAAIGATVPGAAYADLAFNVGGVTDYRYRGISQTRGMGAVQGGVDYSHASGAYAGLWASTIRWVQDAGGNADIEVDLYGGYKGSVTTWLSYDVGGLAYVYPANQLKSVTGADANTVELYAAVTAGPVTLKGSYAVTDTFGNPNSDGSFYLEGAATFELLGGLMLTPHAGWQRIEGPNKGPGSYVDLSLAVSKDLGNGWTVSATGIANKRIDGDFYTSPRNGQRLGGAAIVFGAKYNF